MPSHPPTLAALERCLAFDTSLDHAHLGLQLGTQRWVQQLAGGAQASVLLIDACMALLAQAGLKLQDLQAIAFGAGPGSFTGLRTACAVAQGLGFGAGVPLLAIGTLQAVAQDARRQGATGALCAAVDARMAEVYAWLPGGTEFACKPADLALQGQILVGNAHLTYPELTERARCLNAEPNGHALLDLAAQAWGNGQQMQPAQAQPLYVRNQVALTESERAALKQVAHAS